MAAVLGDQEKYAEAKLLAERALAVQEKALRPDHPDIAKTLDTLAGIYKGLGDEEKADAYLSRAELIRESF